MGAPGPMITHAERAIASAAVALTPSTAALHSLCGRFREELARALAGRAGSLKMLPTFVQPPRGDERGPALFIDWGGTHGRAGCVALDGAGRVEMLREERFTFGEAARAGPAERAFDAIAAALARVIGPEAAPLGFVYSFPARLERIDRAIALPLTKGWRLRGLEGQDVVGLLVGALGRRGLRQATVTAVCNDTVAAMAALTYRLRGLDRRARPADIGLIVGTGSNQAADLGAEG
ncbi:MAG TPA: hexokinase family protein, partial [Candidatus Methylomirabilis sp.]|nr:hexokinase family protein [Candidatus Methylomirabilis sp.]